MKEIEFNINDYVKVFLTDKGKEILCKYYGWTELPEWFEESYRYENGMYKFQMHVLMNVFGKYLYNENTALPFDVNIIIIKED